MNSHKSNHNGTRGANFLALSCACLLLGCATHKISVTVESPYGDRVGPGNIQSTYLGSPGPINCSLRADWECRSPPTGTGGGGGASSAPTTTCTPLSPPCASSFPNGAGVVLFPSAASQPLFTGWTGADCAGAGANPCTVNIDASQPEVINVGAKFREPRIKLTLVGGGLPKDVEVKSTCRVRVQGVMVTEPSYRVMHVSNGQTDTSGLPDGCSPQIYVVANPIPRGNQWGGSAGGTCAGTTGPICNIFMTDDVDITVDYNQ